MAYVIFAIVWPANLDLYQCLVSNNVNMERDTWTMKKSISQIKPYKALQWCSKSKPNSFRQWGTIIKCTKLLKFSIEINWGRDDRCWSTYLRLEYILWRSWNPFCFSSVIKHPMFDKGCLEEKGKTLMKYCPTSRGEIVLGRSLCWREIANMWQIRNQRLDLDLV